MKKNNLYIIYLLMAFVQIACAENLEMNQDLEIQKESVLTRFEQFEEYAKLHSEGLNKIFLISKEENMSFSKLDVETDHFILETVTNMVKCDSQFARIIVNDNQRKDCLNHLESIVKERPCIQVKKTQSRSDAMPTDNPDSEEPITVSDYACSLEEQIATSELVTNAQRQELSEIYTVEVGAKEIMEAEIQKIITSSLFLSLSEKEHNDLLISAAVYIDSANYWMEHLDEWMSGVDGAVVATRGWSDLWGKVKQVARIDADGAFWGAIGGAITGAIGGAGAGTMAGGVGAVPGAAVGAYYGGIGGALSGAIIESARGATLVRSNDMTASTENSTTDAASSTEATETTSATPYVD